MQPRDLNHGRFVALEHDSELLAGNPWNDPVRRIVNVFLPAGYEESGAPLPVIWYLAAYTNSGRSASNWKSFGENIGERVDRLMTEGKLGPVAIVAPDCFTALGGNQYLDSPAVGSYASYIHAELIPFVEARFNFGGAGRRAVVGKSSGGFGAMRFGMDFPGYWAAIGNQSGDCYFDVVMRPGFADVAQVFTDYDGDLEDFVRGFRTQHSPQGRDIHALMHLCLAASYDPGPRLALPFDLETLELDEERWARWLEHDPIHRVERTADHLKALRAIYMDCGNRDQYHIHFGMRLLSRTLEQHGVDHHYEEFEGTHSGIDWRLDRSLPHLYRAIATDDASKIQDDS